MAGRLHPLDLVSPKGCDTASHARLEEPATALYRMEAQRIELAVVRQVLGDGVRVSVGIFSGNGKAYFRQSRDVYWLNEKLDLEEWCRKAERELASECIQQFVYWCQMGKPATEPDQLDPSDCP